MHHKPPTPRGAGGGGPAAAWPENLPLHRAFRERAAQARPLIAVNAGFALLELFPRTLARIPDGPLKPDDIPVDVFLDECETLARIHEGLGDYPCTCAPFVGVPWMEAVAGCPIVAQRNSIWAQPCVRDWTSWRWSEPFRESPWARKLVELMKALAERSAGRYQVTHTLMRGPCDILAAMRGGAELAMDLMDSPAVVDAALWKAAELWSAMGRAQLDCIPESSCGYTAGAAALRSWSPTRGLWLQEDAMAILSPTLYAEHVLPVDRKLSETFESVTFHLHGSALWAIDDLVRLPGLDAIELNLEDANCDVEGTFCGWHKIQERKPVILWRMFGPDFETWLRRVLAEFPPAGLSIQVSARDLKEAEKALRMFEAAAK